MNVFCNARPEILFYFYSCRSWQIRIEDLRMFFFCYHNVLMILYHRSWQIRIEDYAFFVVTKFLIFVTMLRLCWQFSNENFEPTFLWLGVFLFKMTTYHNTMQQTQNTWSEFCIDVFSTMINQSKIIYGLRKMDLGVYRARAKIL